MTHLPAFFAVSALLIMLPGPDTALTVRNVLVGGRANGIRTAAGVASGQTVWALATSVGLAALLAASHPLFVALRIAGAAYLCWLGLQSLSAAVRGRPHEVAVGGGGRAGYRQGLLCNLGNPKMAVFCTSLLPQFAVGFADLFVLGLVFAALTLVWLTAYAVALGLARGLLLRGRGRRALDALTGLALVAFGGRLAAER